MQNPLHPNNLRFSSQWGFVLASKKELSKLLECVSGMCMDSTPCIIYKPMLEFVEAICGAYCVRGRPVQYLQLPLNGMRTECAGLLVGNSQIPSLLLTHTYLAVQVEMLVVVQQNSKFRRTRARRRHSSRMVRRANAERFWTRFRKNKHTYKKRAECGGNLTSPPCKKRRVLLNADSIVKLPANQQPAPENGPLALADGPSASMPIPQPPTSTAAVR